MNLSSDRPSPFIQAHRLFRSSANFQPGLHEYVGKVGLGEPFLPRKLTIECVLPKGYINISHLTLINSRKNAFRTLGFLEMALGDARRFKLLLRNKGLTVVENARALPRAWLTSEALVMSMEFIKAAIKNGVYTDGTEFDPLPIAPIRAGAFHAAGNKRRDAGLSGRK